MSKGLNNLQKMQTPPKPWEIAGVNQRVNPILQTSDGMQSSAPIIGNTGAYMPMPPMHNRSSRGAGVPGAPPLPPRPARQGVQPGYGLGLGNSNFYSNSYPSYGGYTSGYGGYGGYSSYGSYGGYGGYGGYSNYGALGMNRSGYARASNPESRFIQMAEEGSRPAFQSIESLVHAFGSVSFMLESTFNAMYSSFRAVLGVAENFGRLRTLFGQFLSIFAIFRWFQWFYKKCLYLLGLRPNDPSRERLWKEATQAALGKDGDIPRSRTSWPIVVFLGIIMSGPYLMWKLLNSLNIPNIDPFKIRDWALAKELPLGAVALYDFVAGSEHELSLQAGQKLYIAPKDCQHCRNWLLASVDNKRVGYIPANYIKVVGRVQIQMKPAVSPATPNSPEVPVTPVQDKHIPGGSGDAPTISRVPAPLFEPSGNIEEPTL